MLASFQLRHNIVKMEEYTNPQGFPVKSRMFSRQIKGQPTDFVFSAYMDRIVLMVSQVGAVGTVVATTSDAAFEAQAPTFSTTVVCGKRDEPLMQLAARQIVEQAGSRGCTKPMLICMGLKDHSPETMREVVKAVAADNIW